MPVKSWSGYSLTFRVFLVSWSRFIYPSFFCLIKYKEPSVIKLWYWFGSILSFAWILLKFRDIWAPFPWVSASLSSARLRTCICFSNDAIIVLGTWRSATGLIRMLVPQSEFINFNIRMWCPCVRTVINKFQSLSFFRICMSALTNSLFMLGETCRQGGQRDFCILHFCWLDYYIHSHRLV